MNDLDVMAADAEEAYLNQESRERLHTQSLVKTKEDMSTQVLQCVVLTMMLG